MLAELRIAAVLALLAALGLGAWMLDRHVAAGGAAACELVRATDNAAQQKARADLIAAQAASSAQAQADMNAKEARYVQVTQSLAASAAARSADVGRLRKQLAAVAAAAGADAASAGDTCRAQDGQLAVGAGLLSEGVGLVGEGVGLAQRLGAQVAALQSACATQKGSP